MLRNQERKERKSEYAEKQSDNSKIKEYSQVFFKKVTKCMRNLRLFIQVLRFMFNIQRIYILLHGVFSGFLLLLVLFYGEPNQLVAVL